VLARYKEALRAQEEVEERRTFYVAVTRAKHRLFVTGAHWYGDEVLKPKPESVFLNGLMDWAEASGLGAVDRGEPPAEANPLAGYRERFVRDWPGPARPDDGDALFPSGWRRTAAEGGLPLDALTADDRRTFEREAAGMRVLAATLLEREREAPPAARLPTTVSVTGVADYLRCPKRFYWSAVRPLPRFSGPAARIGTQVHAWIERQGSGQASLLELDEMPDLTDEDLAGEPGKVERLREAFLRSRFAHATPLFAERPFLLHIDGHVVGGRIDAIFGTPDGPWEVVDYKTGRKPADDPVAALQLDLYALACVELWGKRPQDLTLTYVYLASQEEDTRPVDDVTAIRDRLARALGEMAAGRFDPTPGEHCHWCDFRSFCAPGRAYVAAARQPEPAAPG
jgi:DNA helicase-2/ATP-dependent DNA helicase PcrA